MLINRSFTFGESRPGRLRKGDRSTRILLTFLILTGLVFSSGCTGWAEKREQALKMVGSGSDEVVKRIGKPDLVTKKTDDSILWVYRPPYKLIPNQKGSIYLEFQDEKVVKAFALK